MGIPITPEGMHLFKSYCGIDRSTLEKRAIAAREQALQLHRYRFIEAFRFLHPRIASNPFFSMIPLKKGKILDVGCGFGTDIRYLALHGALPSDLFGHDIHDGFIKLGFDLFTPISGRGNSLESNLTFLIGALGEGEGEMIKKNKKRSFKWGDFSHRFQIVHAGSILHLLKKNEGEDLIRKVSTLLQPNGIFIGRTAGAETPEFPNDGLRTIHSVSSLTNSLERAGFEEIKVVSHERETLKKEEDRVSYLTLHFYAKLSSS
ncbi:MAG: class I SAM-dependent methyltransferase [Methanobacteriota archaeon]|nr:MAG: class I SAM-dependent methyltransferase [Euryarchaeota archaeon]